MHPPKGQKFLELKYYYFFGAHPAGTLGSLRWYSHCNILRFRNVVCSFRNWSRRSRKCWIICRVWHPYTVGFTTSAASITASLGTTPHTTKTLCATWAVWTSETSQVRQTGFFPHCPRHVVSATCWSNRCPLCRDGETGEGVHARTGRTLRRRSLQLWRAGVVFTLTLVNRCVPHAAKNNNCRCSSFFFPPCSWCILCWKLWGTQTSSGSLIHYMPSMEAT